MSENIEILSLTLMMKENIDGYLKENIISKKNEEIKSCDELTGIYRFHNFSPQ